MVTKYQVLRRHCKICFKEFNSNQQGRLCGHCKYLRYKDYINKNKYKYKAKKKILDALWQKNNPEKNREKARRHWWKKRLKFLISKRTPSHKQVGKEIAIAELRKKIDGIKLI